MPESAESANSHPPIQNVAIVGAGWVGRQVAARVAQSGLNVWLSDRDHTACQAAVAWMTRIADSAGSPEDAAWLERVHTGPATRELREGSSAVEQLPVELVIESVPEQLSLKKRVLKQLGLAFGPDVILASNSSYFVPSLLASYVRHPQRYAHIHFHVPVLSDSVVDIVGCAETAPSTAQRLRDLAVYLGLDPLMLRREHPGYVFNWMLQAVLKSALELVALDVVDMEDVDKSWCDVTGMKLGPFGIMDQIGLDVIEQVLANARWAELPQVDTQALLKLLHEKTQAGKLGTKTLEGFYQYDRDSELH